MAEATLMPRPIGAYPGAPVGEPSNGSNGFVSYYRDLRVDDLGRPAVQHKPLNKGPHTQPSLAKSFADTESSQRPRVWAPPVVHKPNSALTTTDVEGATCKHRPPARGTDPVDPRYKLPTARPSPAPDPITATPTGSWGQMAVAAPDGSSSSTVSGVRPSPSPVPAAGASAPSPAAHGFAAWSSSQDMPPASGRDPLRVSDIQGAAPTPSKAYQPQLQNMMDVKDVEGAQPGWKPPFRAHVGVRLRDPGLQVSDINNYMPRRGATVKRSDDPWVWASGTLTNGVGDGGLAVSTAGGRGRVRPHSAAPSSASQQQNQAQVQGARSSPAVPEFTGLPAFQMERVEVGDGGIPPSALPPPSDASQFASALAGQQQGDLTRLNATIACAQHAAKKLNTREAHDLRVGVAADRVAARAVGTRVAESLTVDRDGVERLWGALRALDREGSGKVTVAEFGRALELSGVSVTPQALRDLVAGMRDGVGLVPYRDLSKALLWKAKAAAKAVAEGGPGGSGGRAARPHTAVPGAGRGAAVQPQGGADVVPGSTGSMGAAIPTTAAAGGGGHAAAGRNSPPPASSPYAAAATAAGTGVPAPSAQPDSAGAALRLQQQQQPPPGPGSSTGSRPASRPASAGPSRSPSSTAVRTAHGHACMQMDEEAAVAAALAGGPVPPGAVLLGPEGAKYFTYKGHTYWFSGNDTREALAQAATEYKATKDETYSVTVRQLRLGLGDGGPMSEHMQSQAVAATNGNASPSPRCIRDAPTISSQLKSGTLSQEELAHRMDVLHQRPESPMVGHRTHARPATARPANASAGTVGGLQPAGRSGASMGAALRAAVRAPGAGGGGPAPGFGSGLGSVPRPASAGPRLGRGNHQPAAGGGSSSATVLYRVAGGQQPASFTSVANSGAKAVAMTRLERAVLREDVATVRTLV